MTNFESKLEPFPSLISGIARMSADSNHLAARNSFVYDKKKPVS